MRVLNCFFHVFPKTLDEKNFVRLNGFIFIFIAIGVILVFYNNYYNFELSSINKYALVSDNTVIVYINEDYYLTLDCEIRKDSEDKEYLIIYRHTENMISTNNVKLSYKNFEDVFLSNDKPEETLFLEEGKIE